VVVAAVVALVAAVGGVTVAAYSGKSPRQAAADARPPAPSTLTAEVEERQLSETIVLRGDVQPVGAVGISVVAGVDVAPVVTALPKKLGDPVAEGESVLEVSGRPVIALQSAVPLYRDILPGSSGADVKALQDSLRRLGLEPSTGSTFDGRTQAAVKGLYERLGYEVADTGKESFALLRQLKTGADDAKDAVGAAERALQEKRQFAPDDTAAESDAVVQAKRRLTEAQTAHSEAAAETGIVLPRAEAVAVPALPGFVSLVSVALGSSPANGRSPLEISSGGLVVASTSVMPAQTALIKPEQRVEFDDDTGAFKGTGKVLSIGMEAQTAEGGDPQVEGGGAPPAGPTPGGSGMVVLRVVPDVAIGAEMNGHQVRISVETASTAEPVVAVPIAAVEDTAEGGAEIVLWPSKERVRIETGLVAGGWVEVRAPTLDVGAKVRLG
jgi:hypothetical protein